jgi:uroporphyrinogen-III synthase
VAAIGSATAEALRLRGIDADFVPKEFVSESVVDGLRPMGTAGASVLLPRSDIGREALAQGLTQQGATVHEVAAYRTVIPEDSGARLAQCLEQGVDVATFTSTSTFRNLGKLLDGDFGRLGGATVACIGPVTAAAVADAGLTADVVAGEHTAPGLLAALVAYYREGGRDE